MEKYRLDYYFENIEANSFKEVFEDCTYAWEPIKKLNSYFDYLISNDIKENRGEIGEIVSISGNYIVGEGTKIGTNVSIEGPVIIGKNCTIQSGALIRPYSLIGDNCVIGHSCEVKHSIIQNKAKVQSFTFIGDSIIGNSARVGSGTILANRRFDQKNITIKNEGSIIDLEENFFGAVIGDSVRIGANSTLLPGSFVGPYTWIFPNVQIRGFIEKEKRVFLEQKLRVESNERLDLQ